LRHRIGTAGCAGFTATSGSEQHDWMALVSVDDQAILGGMVNRTIIDIDFEERQIMLDEA